MSSSFSNKDPNEIVLLTFDFTNALQPAETISSASVDIELLYGADPGVSSMIEGAAIVSGAKVGQKVKNGLSGNTYNVCCTVNTSLSQVLILNGSLHIEAVC